jgi:DNA polymerase III epsilon subunit-like protein
MNPHLETLFVAIDVETANSFRGSICEIGLAKFFTDGTKEFFSSLVKPHPEINKFEYTGIHGISAMDVADAPTLPELWPSIWEFIGDGPLLAHNASFDMGALFDATGFLGLQIPETRYFCTLVFARRVLDLPSFRLSELAKVFGIIQLEAHRAADDARVAGEIALHLLETARLDRLEQLPEALQIAHGILETNKNIGSKKISEFSDHTTSLPRYSPAIQRTELPVQQDTYSAIARERLLSWINQIDPKDLENDGVFHGHEIYFHGDPEVFTPWEGQCLVAIQGGLSSTKITKFTSIVVATSETQGNIKGSEFTLLTPGEFLEMSNKSISDLPKIDKPPLPTSNGVAWIRI